jgi:polysaccharide biosynthesis protein PslH
MKRLLFIAHRLPYPPDKGERVRAFHELKALSRHFRITLASLVPSEPGASTAEELQACCEKVIPGRAGGRSGLLRGALSLCAGKSVTEGYFRDRSILRALLEEARREPFDLVFAYSSSTLPYALAVPSRARVMDLVDVDSAKWASYAEAAWWPKSTLYRMEARGVAALEQRAVEQCDAAFLVSEAEKRALGISSPKVAALGNGVDTEFFQAVDRPAGPPSLVFTGTMDYRPNIEGVCWFVRELWPGLKREVADLTFTIVGRNPAPEVLRLADTPGILVTGAVKDVRPHLAAASVTVVPLHIARGIQNKILEAMACGRAVVASSQAIEGLDVKVGQEVLRADTPDEWRTSILGLLSDEAKQRSLGAAARARVVADYSWDSQMAPMVLRCNKLAAPGKAAGMPMHAAADRKPVGNASELTGRAGEAAL